ncbi:NLRC3 protein, partial [Amia calva]|nr:NLRC3 protein [Amia calva]
MALGPCILELQERRPELVQDWSKHVASFLDVLYRGQVITAEDVSLIRGENLGQMDQMRKLLDVLYSRGEESSRAFIVALNELVHRTRDLQPKPYSNGNGLSLIPSCHTVPVGTAPHGVGEIGKSVGRTESDVPHPESLQDLFQKHKKILVSQYNLVMDYVGNRGQGQPIQKKYTEITLVQKESFTVKGQHEVTEVGNAFKKLELEGMEHVCEFGTICENLLQLHKDTTLLSGVAGSGKTTVTKRLVQVWASDPHTSKIVFVFTFRELNLIMESKSLEDLLSSHYSHLKSILGQVLSSDPSRILIILDGLDEFSLPLDFEKTPKCTDTTLPQRIGDIVVNLIKGNLLPGSTLLITSRPHAVSKLPEQLVRYFYRILGFSSLQQKEYFRKSCDTPEVSEEIWEYISTQRPLLLMCHIPAFCWIVFTALQENVSLKDGNKNSTTVTEIYCRFLKAIVVFHGDQKAGSHIQSLLKATESLRTLKPLLKDLGALAFKGLVERRFIFDPRDLCRFSLDKSELSKMFLVEILKEDRDFLAYEKSYHFVHTSLQEFFAALYYMLESQTGIDPFSCLKPTLLPAPRRIAAKIQKFFGPRKVFRKRVKEAFYCSHRLQSGHLDLFCRFVSGLLVPRTRHILAGVFHPQRGPCTPSALFLFQFLHKQLENCSLPPERQVNVCHCLYEAQDPRMTERMGEWLSRMSQNQAWHSPRDWSELAFLLQLAHHLDELNLENSGLGVEGLRRLLPVLPFFTTLRLGQNPLGREGAVLMAAVLKSPDCKIERLWMVDTRLGSEGVQMLSEGLAKNSTVTDLRMAINSIGDEGARCLAEVLKRNKTLKDIRLRDNVITDQGAELFMAALRENTTLEYLWLFDNKMSKEGVKKMKEFAKTREGLDIKVCI